MTKVTVEFLDGQLLDGEILLVAEATDMQKQIAEVWEGSIAVKEADGNVVIIPASRIDNVCFPAAATDA